MAEQVYEDRWGEILDRGGNDLLELRWFDTTETMSAQEFKEWLVTFAETVERCGRSRVLVDSTSFRMSPDRMDAPWRDDKIIPRYNAAGVVKFAFHMPPDMPMIGLPPAVEGPGRFPTGYFGRRQDALDWLTTGTG
jgi:hypothetical protein